MRFVVVDLEATCWSEADEPERYARQAEESEIIEIGAVMLDQELQEVSEFQQFVRPVRHPVLSEFCTELTSITQDEVEQARLFADVYAAFLEWMGEPGGVELISWGRYDHNQLVAEATAAGMPFPGWRPVDAMEEFSAWVRGRTGRKVRYGMARAMDYLSLPFTGTAHRGIDDARNLVHIVRHIRDVEHRSDNARRVLELMHQRHPRPVNVAHLRGRWPDAKLWFPRAARELIRLRLAVDTGSGRGLQLTERGRALA